MKIIHIITRLIIGGAQENTLLSCEGLHHRGHDVTLLTGPSPGPEGSLMDRACAGGYRVIVTPHLVRSPHPYHDPPSLLGHQRPLPRNQTRRRPHALQQSRHHRPRCTAWRQFQVSSVKFQNNSRETRNSKLETLLPPQSSVLSPHYSRPLVVHTIHGLPFHPYQNALARKTWITLERDAARRCHAIICVADAMTRQALAAGVGNAKNFFTIYSAMETENFLDPGITREEVRTRLHIPQTAYVYGTIARLQPLKGHDDLLSTAATLFEKVPDAHLLWIGDGIFRQRFEQALQQKGWTNRVTLTGLVPPTEVPRLIPAMDVLVHPSYREGLARALPQALLEGVPIISYDCDGAAEVCLDSPPNLPSVQTGMLVKTGDARALVNAMIRMAANRQCRYPHGQRPRPRISAACVSPPAQCSAKSMPSTERLQD